MQSHPRSVGSFLALATCLAIVGFSTCTELNQASEVQEQQTQDLVLSGLPQVGFPSAEVPISDEPIQVAGDEFVVSGPYTHANLEVFLLHSKLPSQPARKILTLEEALRRKLVKVYETGDVQELAIENFSGDCDIFVQAGDIVQGGKQDRVLSVDLLVKPKSGRQPIASFCVEQGRWSARLISASFSASDVRGRTENYFTSSMNALSSKDLKRAVKLSRAQQAVWTEVRKSQAALTLNIGDNVAAQKSVTSLELTLSGDKVKKAQAAYAKSLGSILAGKKNVVGFAFAINGELNSAEVYTSTSLFERLWTKSLQACSVEAVSLADKFKDGGEPTSVAAVQSFLSVNKGTVGKGYAVDSRVQMVTADGEAAIFTESRDRENESRWFHRSYIGK